MNIFERIKHFIDNLEQRTFYLYVGGSLLGLLVIIGIILYSYYSALANLEERMLTINEQRLNVKRMLAVYERVKKHKTEVDALMAQEPNFKIISYFDGVLIKLGLADKKTIQTPSHIEHEGAYSETILKVQLTDMDMKQLCEVLNELEHNKRIFTKELEIIKSKKKKKVLDVALTIATLEPKS
jgi:hypothetical protein